MAVPAGEGPWPAAVVVHEAFGLTQDIRAWCDRFAGEGYIALAPDLLHWGSAPRCLLAAFRSLRSGRGRGFMEIEATTMGWMGAIDRVARFGLHEPSAQDAWGRVRAFVDTHLRGAAA